MPYERLQYKYCTMNCLKEHRTQLHTKWQSVHRDDFYKDGMAADVYIGHPSYNLAS